MAAILERHRGPAARSWALWSGCRRYRHALARRWGPGRLPLFVLLNPSTADAAGDDATLARCVARARAAGAPGLCVVNLFALCATDPAALARHPDPVGPGTDAVIASRARRAAWILCGWGNHGARGGRAAAVMALLVAAGPPLVHLGLTARGAPRHPLYVSPRRAAEPWDPGLPGPVRGAILPAMLRAGGRGRTG